MSHFTFLNEGLKNQPKKIIFSKNVYYDVIKKKKHFLKKLFFSVDLCKINFLSKIAYIPGPSFKNLKCDICYVKVA